MTVKLANAEFLTPYSGTIEFIQKKDSVVIRGTIGGFEVGTEHGVHITLTTPADGIDYFKIIFGKGDHGCPGITDGHRQGDLGNFTSNKQGELEISAKVQGLKVSEILGRNLAVLTDKDTCQPDFNSEILVSSVIAVI